MLAFLLTRIEQADQSGGYAVAEKRIDFAYNAASQFNTITRYADLAGTDLVVTTSYAYDGIGRIDELLHEQDTTTLAGYEYAWDAASRITAITNVVYAAESATYDYDDRGQLTAADRTGSGNDEAYAYDTNGNRDTANGDTYAVDPNNQIQSDGTYDYLYDAEGNRIRKTEIATDDYVTYTWDYRNRLTDVRYFDDSDVLQKHVAYVYDAFDRRIVKQVDADGDSDFDSAEAYVYDGAHVALRFVDPDGDGAADSSLANRYVHGPVIDQVLADEQVHWDAIGEDYVTDDLYWPLADHLGSVRDVAEYNPGTDTTSVANHLTIDSFGRITAETNSAVDHLFAFTGRERDDDAGLHYYRARWYDPAVGQFVSQDPIGFRAQDTNLHRYVGNHPTMATDPSGLAEPFSMQRNGFFTNDPEYNAWRSAELERVWRTRTACTRCHELIRIPYHGDFDSVFSVSPIRLREWQRQADETAAVKDAAATRMAIGVVEATGAFVAAGVPGGQAFALVLAAKASDSLATGVSQMVQAEYGTPETKQTVASQVFEGSMLAIGPPGRGKEEIRQIADVLGEWWVFAAPSPSRLSPFQRFNANAKAKSLTLNQGLGRTASGRCPTPTVAGNVRVYRVEGIPNSHVEIGENGLVAIREGDQTVFFNFGSKTRAEQYLAQKLNPAQAQGPLPGATVKSFEVPRSFLEELRTTAVTERQFNLDPSLAGRPLLVDISKAADQFGLRPEQLKDLREAIVQGTGRTGLE